MKDSQENFLLRLLGKLNSCSSDTLLALTFCCAFVCLGSTIVGGMAVSYFAPPDPNPPPTVSPAMDTLRTCIYRTADPDLKKYYTEKLLDLEEKENGRQQIVVHQITSPPTSEDASEK